MLISLLNVASVSVYVSMYLDMQMRVKISFNRDLEHFSKIEQYRETMSKIRDETQPVVRTKAIFSSLCTIGFLIQQLQLLHSLSKRFQGLFSIFFCCWEKISVPHSQQGGKKSSTSELRW